MLEFLRHEVEVLVPQMLQSTALMWAAVQQDHQLHCGRCRLREQGIVSDFPWL